MMYKFNYKENKNLANLLPFIDEVYVKSVISTDESDKNNKKQAKLPQKAAAKYPLNLQNTLRERWGDWYVPLLSFQNDLNKFKRKLPTFYRVKAVGFGVYLEQATSEFIARWKAKQFTAKTMVSLTGGLGVDDWAWASTDCDVYSFDPNESLNFWSTLNFDRLGVDHKIQRINQTAEWALENWVQWQTEDFVDVIYIDPDRRPNTNSNNSTVRIITDVNQYNPNVFELYKNHKLKANQWLIKLSPMVDIHWFQKQIGEPVKAYSVCAGKEVKEILVVLPGQQSFTQKNIIEKEMVNISEYSADLFTHFYSMAGSSTNLKEGIETTIQSKLSINSNSMEVSKIQPSQTLLFEPHAGLFALGLNRQLSELPGVSTLGNYSFFITPNLWPKTLGRTLIVNHIFNGSLREIGRKLKENNLFKITITARNCGIKTADLIKQLGTKENHLLHGFIYKDENGFTLYIGTI